MKTRIWLAVAIALHGSLSNTPAVLAFGPCPVQDDGVKALDGEWIFVEDRTEDREIEKQQPSMSARVRLRVEEKAVILVRRDTEIRIPFDGSANDVDIVGNGSISRYSGTWKDGAFVYQSTRVDESGAASDGLIQWVLRPTEDGLLARVAVGSPATFESVALYRHPDDIPLPEPAKAVISDLAWLVGDWVGTRGKSSIEERWSPPLGGALLGMSRTVSRDRMVAFEYLRIVERDGSLVYIAQPGGTSPTEFVLTNLEDNRAVFENPRHDSPQRIVYELSAEGDLSASIGYIKGGRPQRFDFKREGN